MKTFFFIVTALVSTLSIAQDGPGNSALYTTSRKAELNYDCEYKGQKIVGKVVLDSNKVLGDQFLPLGDKNAVHFTLKRDRTLNDIRFEIFVNRSKNELPRSTTFGFLTENKQFTKYGMELDVKNVPLTCLLEAELF